MTIPPPEIIIYVALKPAEVVRGSDGKMQWITWEVPISQLQRHAQAVYDRLSASGREAAKLMFTHASPDGEIAKLNLAMIKAYQPDAVYTCFPAESRQLYPDIPIQGWHHHETWGWFPDKQRVIRITL